MPSWSQSQRAKELRQAVKLDYRRAEAEVMQRLQAYSPLHQLDWEAARGIAGELISHLRQSQPANRIEPLLSEFSLASGEGTALMSLTEALLRVPDDYTSRQLIADKLLDGAWIRHCGSRQPLFINCVALGLQLARGVIAIGGPERWAGADATEPGRPLRAAFKSLSGALLNRSVRAAIHTLGTGFVQGKTITEALQRARHGHSRSCRFSFDMLGEGARTQAAADDYFDQYRQAIEAVGAASDKAPQRRSSVSVKLSALHPRYEHSQTARLLTELVPKLTALALQAQARGIELTVDAEEARRLDLSLDIIEAVFRDRRLDGWDGFGLAVQAYQKRAVAVVNWALQLARDCNRPLNLRLVKGAYWDSEIKWTQLGGYKDYPVFTNKAATDLSYLTCADILLRERQLLRPQFATHNACTVAAVIALDEAICNANNSTLAATSGYEFQRLYGMGATLHEQVTSRFGVPCRVYAPVGQHRDLLPYLVRRMLENGANSSFVHQLAAASGPLDELLQQPPSSAAPLRRNSRIPLPQDLFRQFAGKENSSWELSGRELSSRSPPTRENSSGLELVDDLARQRLDQLLQTWQPPDLTDAGTAAPVPVLNPADRSQRVGQVQHDSPRQMCVKLQQAAAALPQWSATPVARRAEILRACAASIQAQREELILLLVKESGKTLLDSDAEVREAIDFCRYYADQAEALLQPGADGAAGVGQGLRPRGVVFCISPWNFPLAIFIGQVSAALAAGNTVIAKPADQTSLIAIKTRQILLEAALPEAVLQLILARGKLAGETLIGQPALQAVVFTGSIATARWLAQRLAQRTSDVALVAETGGQNTMIVDATALPEQVVDDVLQSAFQSAGQRCSALRVLYLQEEVADDIILLLRQAMAELVIGDPALMATDVGPVIDAAAVARLQKHQQYLQGLGEQVKLLQQLRLPESCSGGDFFAPCLYEIAAISLLPEEVFGPILHVIRYARTALPRVIADINSTGFGLTMGIHTRIDRRAEAIAEQVKAGNIYVNRNMIGAVVGVQPFGGQGLSGTGPKAGGPHYLTRLVTRASPAAENTAVGLEAGEYAALQIPTTSNTELLQQLPPEPDFMARLELDPRYALALRACDYFAAPLAAAMQDVLETVKQDWWPFQPLPGPVGEANSLRYQPRGLLVQILAEATSGEDELLRLWAALLTGNAVAVLAPVARLSAVSGWLQNFAAAGFPTRLFTLLPLATSLSVLRSERLGGLLISATSPHLPTLKACLLEYHQALLPVITETHHHELLPRLLLEKTISVNTAARGGITELLADPP